MKRLGGLVIPAKMPPVAALRDCAAAHRRRLQDELDEPTAVPIANAFLRDMLAKYEI